MVAQPVALTVLKSGQLPIGPTRDWTNPFIGDDAAWDVPGGSWDPATGRWTCPQIGLYQISALLEIDPFGAGNKNYYAGLQLRIIGEIGRIQETYDGGDDDIPLGVSFTGQQVFYQGDTIEFKITAVHENQTGTVAAQTHMQLLNVSG